jgi:NAD(P)-dependent dehydrogenase (short-subunit alcohol dehydrogenase family)
VVITGAPKSIGRSIGLDAAGEDYLQGLERSMPTAMLGETVDIVYAMRFLVADEAKSITGQTLVVDGGQTLPEPILALVQGVSPVSGRRGHSDDGRAILAPAVRFGRWAGTAD